MTEITELSKETLGSYIKKSIPNIQQHSNKINSLHKKLADSGARPWSMSDHAKNIQNDIHKSQRAFKNRYAGLISAVHKGSKAVSNNSDHKNKDIHHDHDFRYNSDGTTIKPLKITHDLNNSPKTPSGKRVLKRIYHYEGPRKEEHNLKSPSKSSVTRNNGFIIHKNEHGEVISKKPIDNGIKHLPTVETKTSVPKMASRRSVDKEGNISHYNKAGKLHNSDGPAVEHKNGYKAWMHDGKYHNDHGPAVIHANGSKHWYKHGVKHREDGPAVEHKNGKKEFWIMGKKQTIKEDTNMSDIKKAKNKLTKESVESDIRLDDLHTMLNNMLDSQPGEFKTTFTDVLTNKISDKIEAMKQNIAQSLFNNEVEEEQVEESEQIDELSKKTLGSYIKKARDTDNEYRQAVANAGGFKVNTRGDELLAGSKIASFHAKRKINNKNLGINRAVDKLTKEDVQN